MTGCAIIHPTWGGVRLFLIEDVVRSLLTQLLHWYWGRFRTTPPLRTHELVNVPAYSRWRCFLHDWEAVMCTANVVHVSCRFALTGLAIWYLHPNGKCLELAGQRRL